MGTTPQEASFISRVVCPSMLFPELGILRPHLQTKGVARMEKRSRRVIDSHGPSLTALFLTACRIGGSQEQGDGVQTSALRLRMHG